MYLPKAQVARMIDYTLLYPGATREDLVKLCQEAQTYGFWSVCVNPFWVHSAYELLKDRGIRVCSVVGFPLGATLTRVKVIEAEEVIANGAQEVDMVANIGALRSGNYEVVKEDIASVVRVARKFKDITVKVILETQLLSAAETLVICRLAQEAGADFVKTSTGLGAARATVSHVRLLRRCVGNTIGVKASGGIRTYRDFVRMVSAGADRIGTSAGVKIILEAPDTAVDKELEQ